ncbi:DUF4386 domain-containing protein [Paenibacillus sp. GCM10023248]|uniref:DUF4386 domain-containing protein n=1 Tax=Bacillales TaxID=1385 RepID=UPI0023782D6E|nr:MULTISPECIES: DUF4386 domain-containing protein [Bacillales]MDD9265597.1 DUF4386 domain-containing protein [Paenibacillus sp. MAHUQ-63]MDR6878835.1 hypothetical protein [Bacillus sp. 3255]
MTMRGKERTEQRKFALITGTSLMIMMVAAIFSYGIVHQSLQVQGDASTTLQNIISKHLLLHAEILGWIIILICDIVAAWSLYVFLKPVDPNLSLLAAWLRLAYAALLGIAIMNLIYLQLVTSNPADCQSFVTIDQLHGQVLLNLRAFDSMWSVGLIVFGGHLLIVGILTLQSKTMPKWIGVLMCAAAVSYFIIHVGKIMLPAHSDIMMILERVLIVPMTAGELGFGIWLLFRGGKPLLDPAE